jgi:hypothetical protein
VTTKDHSLATVVHHGIPPPWLSGSSPPCAACLPGVGLAHRFALDPPEDGGRKCADGEESAAGTEHGDSHATGAATTAGACLRGPDQFGVTDSDGVA